MELPQVILPKSLSLSIVTPINTPPVVTQQNVSTRTNIPLNVTLAASDADDDTLQHSIISQPGNGTLGKINQTTHTVTYTPNPDFTGSDSFTHTVNDGKVNSETGKVNINVRKK